MCLFTWNSDCRTCGQRLLYDAAVGGQTHRVCNSTSALTWCGGVCWSQCPHRLNQTSHPTARSEGQRNHGKYMRLSNFELTFCKSKSTLKSQVYCLLFLFASINCEIKRSSGCQNPHPPTAPGNNAGVWDRGRGSGQQLCHQLACRPAPARTGLLFVSPSEE